MSDHRRDERPTRLFVALDLPRSVRSHLTRLGQTIATSAADVRSVPDDNLHITLAFLGAVPRDAARRLAELLEARLHGPPPQARLGRLVGRPSNTRTRLVAAEIVDVDGRIAALAADVAACCTACVPGFRPPARAFWPHVTVARFRRPGGVRGFPPIDHEHVFDITRASLYDSHIITGGPPRYEALKEVTLDGTFAERSSIHG